MRTETVWSLEDLDEDLRRVVGPVESLLDLGAGIRPQDVLSARRSFRVDAWPRYRPDVVADLRRRLPFVNDAVDVTWCSDVIEHLPKADGKNLLGEMDRVSRRGVVVRTPVGFHPQDPEDVPWEIDREVRNPYQRHVSGWNPEEILVPGGVAFVIPQQPNHSNLWYRYVSWFAVWRPKR